ncbi:MAG: alpha/beta hydrolase family protein [Acidimicrobiales bacterium]
MPSSAKPFSRRWRVSPVKPGFMALHPDQAFNYFMNRLAQTNEPGELIEVGRRISTVEDWTREMAAAAERAEADGRHLNAAHYWRATEFYTSPAAPGKAEAYERFLELHDRALPEVAAMRTSVPFDGAHLPVIDVPPQGEHRGVIVMHSGFDGASEETYPSAAALAGAGYRVLLFDGPGQGSALRRSGLHMTHDWERPVSTLLDHFGIDECTLIGVSLGGYLAPRAAAFEPRVARVVSWGAMYDFAACFRKRIGDASFEALMTLVDQGARDELNEVVDAAMAVNAEAAWAVNHGRHVSGSDDTFSYFQWLTTMNLREVSERIGQDMLIVMGTDDHLVPFGQVHEQIAAATNARSVTVRITTAAEQGAEHCQVGNPMLVVDEILRWLDGLRRRDEHLADCRPNLVSMVGVSNPR